MSLLRRRRRSRSGPEAEIGPRKPSGGRPGWGRAIEITAAFLAIVGFGFLVGPRIEALFAKEGRAKLEVAEVAVANVPAEFSVVGDGELDQAPSTEPRIEATVRNLGKETAWVEEARITLIDSAYMSICLTQGGSGGVPRTEPYRVSLPDFPRTGHRVIRRELHVEVQPGHGARPVLTFQNEDLETSTLYALRVELIADPGGRTLDAGRFVVGVPGPVNRNGQTFPESEEVLFNPSTNPGEALSTWCFRHNLTGMRRVTGRPGQRSAYLAALAHLQLAPGWSSFADHQPPRAAARELLRSGGGDAAVYAVEAAERTGDEDFEARVRKQAVYLLLRMGREDLALDSPRNAIEEAERILSLESSEAAKHLLWKAEALSPAG